MVTDIRKLLPFTGYYSMNVAPGAFLSIDTVEERSTSGDTTTISINVSMDGRSCTAYSFSDGASFDGSRLDIPGRLSLDFTRHYRDGRLAAFEGTIGSVSVAGDTYFNQVPLSAFAGDYFDVATSRKALSIADNLEIFFDFALFTNAPGDLRKVDGYSYLPAMFVLTFAGATTPQPGAFTLMLGTAGNKGLACSIQGGGIPKLAVSILPHSTD